MKLLNKNVHSWLEGKSRGKNGKYCAKVIAEKRYDVVALQEVNQQIKSKPVLEDMKEDNSLYQLLKKIRKSMEERYEYFWSHSHIGFDIYEEGILLSRHPILEKDAFYCTDSQTIHSISSRKIVKITLEIEGEKIEFYSCHMNLPDCREERWKKIFRLF